MINTIFTDDLPFVTNSNELEKIKRLHPSYDSYYLASACIRERKTKFNKLWEKFEPYSDSHFLPEIKIHFHQRTWEMYLGNVLLENNFKLLSSDNGPDFIIKGNEYVECVACTKGKKGNSDSVPEMRNGVGTVPMDKMILRICNSIAEKSKKYQYWKKKNKIDLNKPYIIAINTSDLDYPENSGMPTVIQALFGFQHMQINLNTRETSYTYRRSINKTNNEPIPVNYFASKASSFISGVLFSNKSVLNHPDKLGDDCIFVNNPFAVNMVSSSFKSSFKNWTADIDDNRLNLTRNYDINVYS